MFIKAIVYSIKLLFDNQIFLIAIAIVPINLFLFKFRLLIPRLLGLMGYPSLKLFSGILLYIIIPVPLFMFIVFRIYPLLMHCPLPFPLSKLIDHISVLYKLSFFIGVFAILIFMIRPLRVIICKYPQLLDSIYFVVILRFVQELTIISHCPEIFFSRYYQLIFPDFFSTGFIIASFLLIDLGITKLMRESAVMLKFINRYDSKKYAVFFIPAVLTQIMPLLIISQFTFCELRILNQRYNNLHFEKPSLISIVEIAAYQEILRYCATEKLQYSLNPFLKDMCQKRTNQSQKFNNEIKCDPLL